jgi:hypothetical protein
MSYAGKLRRIDYDRLEHVPETTDAFTRAHPADG